jgi:hypothetical protein
VADTPSKSFLPLTLALLPSLAVLGSGRTQQQQHRCCSRSKQDELDYYDHDEHDEHQHTMSSTTSSSSRSLCSGQFSTDDLVEDHGPSDCDTTTITTNSSSLLASTRDSLLVYLGRRHQSSVDTTKKDHHDNNHEDDDDDDTVSTATNTSVDDVDDDDEYCDDSTLSSSSSSTTTTSTKRVSFAPKLVSQVYTRPTTKLCEKYYLYYTEYDYMDFKLHYMSHGRSKMCKRSPRKVEWKLDVVREVHDVMDSKTRQQHDLYYTESELQGFLDDFVVSLQQQQQQVQR